MDSPMPHGKLASTGKLIRMSNFDMYLQDHRFMGSLSNNGRKLANFAGFYKGIQSAGAAITWRLDDNGISFMSMFASNWALLAGSLLIALPVILWKVEDTVDLAKDIAFTDETVEEVAPKARVISANDHLSEKV